MWTIFCKLFGNRCCLQADLWLEPIFLGCFCVNLCYDQDLIETMHLISDFHWHAEERNHKMANYKLLGLTELFCLINTAIFKLSCRISFWISVNRSVDLLTAQTLLSTDLCRTWFTCRIVSLRSNSSCSWLKLCRCSFCWNLDKFEPGRTSLLLAETRSFMQLHVAFLMFWLMNFLKHAAEINVRT